MLMRPVPKHACLGFFVGGLILYKGIGPVLLHTFRCTRLLLLHSPLYSTAIMKIWCGILSLCMGCSWNFRSGLFALVIQVAAHALDAECILWPLGPKKRHCKVPENNQLQGQ